MPKVKDSPVSKESDKPSLLLSNIFVCIDVFLLMNNFSYHVDLSLTIILELNSFDNPLLLLLVGNLN